MPIVRLLLCIAIRHCAELLTALPDLGCIGPIGELHPSFSANGIIHPKNNRYGCILRATNECLAGNQQRFSF